MRIGNECKVSSFQYSKLVEFLKSELHKVPPLTGYLDLFKRWKSLPKIHTLRKRCTRLPAAFADAFADSWWKKTQPSSAIPWTLQTKNGESVPRKVENVSQNVGIWTLCQSILVILRNVL